MSVNLPLNQKNLSKKVGILLFLNVNVLKLKVQCMASNIIYQVALASKINFEALELLC